MMYKFAVLIIFLFSLIDFINFNKTLFCILEAKKPVLRSSKNSDHGCSSLDGRAGKLFFFQRILNTP